MKLRTKRLYASVLGASGSGPEFCWIRKSAFLADGVTQFRGLAHRRMTLFDAKLKTS